MTEVKRSGYQIATAEADKALADLAQHDSRIEECEAKLEAAQAANKSAVSTARNLDEARSIKSETAADVDVLTDVLADLMTEREGKVAALTQAYEGMGQAQYDGAEARYLAAMKEVCGHLKKAEKAYAEMAKQDEILSAQAMYKMLDDVTTDMVRVFLTSSGRTPKLPNNRGIKDYKGILDWWGDRSRSDHSRKIAVHMAKQKKWALAPRDSEEYLNGRMKYLKKQAARKSAA